MLKKLPILFFSLFICFPASCTLKNSEKKFSDLKVTGSLELQYAEEFSADFLEGGYSLITINGDGRFLVVPEGYKPPENIDGDITVLKQPIENIYLAATSAMCLFDSLDVLGSIAMSGTKADGWYIENARTAMERGEIVYAGKYNAPDYEIIVSKNCGLAIESTMISHSPEVKEKFENLGIPVLVERSSYESHPLGRTEWIKLYGLLMEQEEKADNLFKIQNEYINNISTENTGKTAVFFYINSAGGAVTRASGDYIAEMIEIAGGKYVFENLKSGNSAGSVNISMENFYKEAKEADFIIYNSSVDGELQNISELLEKSGLISEFKAVKNKNVWCTSKNLFQETTEFGLMISDMNRIFSGKADGIDKLNFLYRLQ